MNDWTSQDWIDSDERVTFEQARREIELHGLSVTDFLRDTYGDPAPVATVPARDVLLWLGY